MGTRARTTTQKNISLARSLGVEIGGLNWKTYRKCIDNGWYDILLIGEFSYLLWHVQDSDMCISRMRKGSKVTHPVVVRNSCSSLSDAEPTVVDFEPDDQESSRSGSKAGSPNCQSKESSKPSKSSKTLKLNAGSQEVSEAKYMDEKCFKAESCNSLFDEFKRKTLDRLVEKTQREAQRILDIAKQIQVMDNLSDESKAEVYEIIFQMI